MRASGIAITDALAAAPHEGLAPRQFVWMTVRRRDNGNLVSFGLWNGSVPVTLDVVSGETGLIVSRLYEPGALKSVEKVRLTTGLRYKPWSFTLDKNNPRIKLALREYDPRLGQVEYHRVPLSMTSRRPVAPPRCRFIGHIDGTEFTRPKANGEGGVVVSCIGATAELTKMNPAKRSVESTQRRAGDMHRVGKPWMRSKGSRFTPFTPTVLGGAKAPVWVGPAGVGTNTGTDAAPLYSVAQALLAGATRVILKDGLYAPEQLTISGASFTGLEVAAAKDARPITRGGIHLTGFVPAAGRTDVYVASLGVAPSLWHATNPKGFLFCLSAPYSAISAADRHPAHLGRSHRLPHYPFFPYANLDALEAAPQPGWFFDNAAQMVYVRSVPGIDPATMVVVVPNGVAVSGGSRKNSLYMQGVTYEFMGLQFDDMARYDLSGLMVVGAPTDGFSLDNTFGRDEFCTVVGSSNDNWNLHGYGVGTPGRQDGYSTIDYTNRSFEPYSAWAWDDGRSAHEKAREMVDGGLLEFNGSCAIAPAGGSESTIKHSELRNNGWDQPGEGAVGVVNPLEFDDGTGTTALCIGVVVRGGARAFTTKNGSGQTLTARDCRTYDMSVAQFDAEANTRIVAESHRDSGSAAKFVGAGTFVELSAA